MSNEFLPSNYNVPEADGGYMKLRQGENQFRIMSQAILGWEVWIDGKPKRFREDEDLPIDIQEKADIDEKTGEPRPARHFMAFIVWNRNAEPKPKLQILELTQKSIKKAINALNRSKSWGNPIGDEGYDILINKEGEGFDTEYSTNPAPKEKLDKSITDFYKKADIDLEALYKGDDPFASGKEKAGDKFVDEMEEEVNKSN